MEKCSEKMKTLSVRMTRPTLRSLGVGIEVGIADSRTYRRLHANSAARPARAGLAKGGIVTELNNSRQCYFLGAPPSALRKKRKNSEFGSSTSKSLRLRKLARYASRLR